MSNFEKPKNLPLGTGETFVQERAKETLPALEVKNTVLWVNPAFKDTMPFKIEQGKQTNLGIFFTPKPEEYPEEKARKPIIMPEYNMGRSGLEGGVIFKDNDGRLYRDVDVKGIGKFYKEYDTGMYRVGTIAAQGEPRNAQGLMDYELALRDQKYSEKFLKAGIRTHRIIAITELEEIIDEHGKKISIEEARKKGIISEEMQPVIEVRTFGTKERIDYLGAGAASGKKVLLDAKAMVAQELGVEPEQFSFDDYLEWFAKTLGTEVARIRKLKLHHNYLTQHNITLDCRIVDLDSVIPVKERISEPPYDHSTTEELYGYDLDAARVSLNTFLRRFDSIYENLTPEFAKKIYNIYETAYQEELKTKPKTKKERGEVEPSSTKQKKAQEKKAA